MGRLLIILFTFSVCASAAPLTKVYQISKCGPISVVLKLDSSNSQGEVELRDGGKANKFRVENLSKDKQKLFLRRNGEKYKAQLEGEIVGNTIINFRSILNNRTLWKCDLPLAN